MYICVCAHAYKWHVWVAKMLAMLESSFVPRLSHPNICRWHAMTYLDVWRGGTFLEKQQVSECAADHKHGPLNDWVLNIRQSWRRFLDSESRFTAEQKECATPPHVQARHCTWLSFTRPSPALVLQATNDGVRRPGYKATYIRCACSMSATAGHHPQCSGYGFVSGCSQKAKILSLDSNIFCTISFCFLRTCVGSLSEVCIIKCSFILATTYW